MTFQKNRLFFRFDFGRHLIGSLSLVLPLRRENRLSRAVLRDDDDDDDDAPADHYDDDIYSDCDEIKLIYWAYCM